MCRGRLAAALAVPALAAAVAFAVQRPAPRFAAPAIAIVRDGTGRALWSVRLAAAADEIAVDRLAAAAPADRAYQLWLATPLGPRSIGVLPRDGGAVIPEMPALVARLRGRGELLVSREPEGGSPRPVPTGPIVFRAAFANRQRR